MWGGGWDRRVGQRAPPAHAGGGRRLSTPAEGAYWPRRGRRPRTPPPLGGGGAAANLHPPPLPTPSQSHVKPNLTAVKAGLLAAVVPETLVKHSLYEEGVLGKGDP